MLQGEGLKTTLKHLATPLYMKIEPVYVLALEMQSVYYFEILI